ncbi:MAG: hypothetical protein EYC68_20055 [Chloroflexota bacterium]|nr:MAG: hypothetical protein EYC68_20055 [Chloroflexota bacterium]
MRAKFFSPHLFVLLAFATLIAAPLSAPGYFMFAHDARHTVYFMQMFDAALRDGALFPRWATDMVFGYGYPVWLILAPLPYYGAEFFHLLGLDFPSSIKAIEAVGWFAGALGMFLFASRVLGKDSGLVAAIAYLFVPYHIVDLYVRGAMAEFLAFVFPPFILWGIYQIFSTRRVFYVPLTALLYGAMLLTHVQMTVLFSPVIAGYILVLWWADRRRATNAQSPNHPITQSPNHPIIQSSLHTFTFSPLLRSAFAIVWGVALAAVFFLPILLEQKYLTNDPLIGGFFNFRLHFVNPAQLVSPFWGYGYAGTNGSDQFSLQLGIMPLFFGIIALFNLKRGQARSAQIFYFALVTLGAVFAMLVLSTPLWELAAPIVAFTQFPWRVLFVSAFALAFLAGASVRAIDAENQFRAALFFALLVSFAMFPYARPQYTETQFTWNTMMDFQVKDRELLGDTIWVETRPQDSPLVAQYRAGNITTKAVVLEGDAQIELLERRPLGDTVRVNAATPSRIMFYTRDFPGWTATLDGNAAEIKHDNEQGLITIEVPAGTHIAATHWGTTPARVIGAIISFVSLVFALIVLWRTRK